MADLKNITISELPFKDTLEDTNIIHIADGEDKQSTLARLMAWLRSKVSFTTIAKDKNVILSTSSGEAERIPLVNFSQEIMGGLLNSLNPINKPSLLSQGFSEIEIFSYEVARKSPLRSLGEYFYMDIADNEDLNSFLDSTQAQAYLLSFGISLANGQNGSRDGRGVFLRAVDAGAGRESETRQIGQIQEDAMQKIEGKVVMRGGAIQFNTENSALFGTINTGNETQVTSGNDMQHLNFDSSRVTRTASETRPKNINALLFQKVQDIDWRLIPSTPSKF